MIDFPQTLTKWAEAHGFLPPGNDLKAKIIAEHGTILAFAAWAAIKPQDVTRVISGRKLKTNGVNDLAARVYYALYWPRDKYAAWLLNLNPPPTSDGK